jgi:hypothetical protein
MRERKDRVRRTREEWAGILRRFESSGLDSKTYCRRAGLSLSSFQRWRSRLAAHAAAEFVELTPSSPDSATSGWELEVTLPNGVRLQFRG